MTTTTGPPTAGDILDACPFITRDECAMVREREVAGTPALARSCTLHDVGALPIGTRCGIHGLDTSSGRCAECDRDRGQNASGLSLCGTCTGTRYIVNPNSGDVETCPACHGEGVR